MTSTELKHQARQQKWVAAIQNCRSSGLPVRQWCKQRGITPSTYYRWEREVLSIADAAPEFPGHLRLQSYQHRNSRIGTFQNVPPRCGSAIAALTSIKS